MKMEVEAEGAVNADGGKEGGEAAAVPEETPSASEPQKPPIVTPSSSDAQKM